MVKDIHVTEAVLFLKGLNFIQKTSEPYAPVKKAFLVPYNVVRSNRAIVVGIY